MEFDWIRTPLDIPNETHRTGHTEQDTSNGTYGTGHTEWDIPNWTYQTGHTKQDIPKGTYRMGHTEWNIKNRTCWTHPTGHTEWDIPNRTYRKGHTEQDTLNGTYQRIERDGKGSGNMELTLGWHGWPNHVNERKKKVFWGQTILPKLVQDGTILWKKSRCEIMGWVKNQIFQSADSNSWINLHLSPGRLCCRGTE